MDSLQWTDAVRMMVQFFCTFWWCFFFLLCIESISSYVCTYSVLFCVLHCPFRYGDQTHSHTPRLLFLGNVKAMYTSPLKRIRLHSFHLLLSPLSFSLTLPVVLLYHHLSNCKVVVPVFLCLVFASSITTWWWLWKPIWSLSRRWLKSLLVLFIFYFSFITALFFCSPTALHFVTCLAKMQTRRYQLWIPSAVLCHAIKMC